MLERTHDDVLHRGCAATSLLRAERLVSARCNAALEPLGLALATYEALLGLRFSPDGALPLGVLALHLEVAPAKVTKLVDRLQHAGYVERRPHPSDRRAVVAAVTPAGREALEDALRRLGGIGFGLDPLGDEERERLLGLTRAVRGR